MSVESFKGKNFLRGCYFNRNDPRVWVHCDGKYKAAGVTLNFAKAADQTARETICLVLGLFAVWCPLVVVTCFWMAARDLKRHPGPQGLR